MKAIDKVNTWIENVTEAIKSQLGREDVTVKWKLENDDFLIDVTWNDQTTKYKMNAKTKHLQIVEGLNNVQN